MKFLEWQSPLMIYEICKYLLPHQKKKKQKKPKTQPNQTYAKEMFRKIIFFPFFAEESDSVYQN